MDKQGKTITIKINGTDRPVQEDKKIEDNDRKKNNQEKRIEKPEIEKAKGENYRIKESSDDKYKVYPLDNDPVINETAAAQEQTEETFDWILPDPIDKEAVKEYEIAPKQEKKKKKKNIGISVWNPKIKRNNRLYTTIFVTVFFAVLLGTAFGVTILKFVTADSETAAPAATTPTGEPAAKAPAAGSESLELKPIPAFIVQNGIFTKEADAKERMNLLSAQGVSAELFPVNDKFAVYLAAAGSIEAAKQQAEALKAKGVEVFAKPFEISGGTAAELKPEEKKFLEQAPEIYSIMIGGADASPEEIKKVEDYSKILGGITDKSIKDKTILKAKAAMEQASSSFLSYQKNNDANQLTEMEKGLLTFLSAYQSIGQ